MSHSLPEQVSFSFKVKSGLTNCKRSRFVTVDGFMDYEGPGLIVVKTMRGYGCMQKL